MLEYFSYKKLKKNKEKQEAKDEAGKDVVQGELKLKTEGGNADSDRQGPGKEPLQNKDQKHDHKHDSRSVLRHQTTVLKPEDESFLAELLANKDEGPPPPLPPRIYAWDLDWPSDNEGASGDESRKEIDAGKAAEKTGQAETIKKTEKAEKKPNRLSLLFTKHKKHDDSLKSGGEVTPKEVEREKKDLSFVLDRLNLSAKNNKVISQSKESSELLQKFTQVFKDLVNGVPTAYDDLTKLIEDRDGTINKLFDKLPSSLQKLVTQMPEKLTSSLAPELLAAAAKSQGLKAAEGSMKGTAMKMLMPQNLAELVTKPGAIVGMLRAIVEVLKTRWPAFIGMNVIWSVALSLLLVVLWYCYKRGREERLLREQSDVEDDNQRFEELPDDPTLPAPEQGSEVIPAVKITPPESISIPKPSNPPNCP